MRQVPVTVTTPPVAVASVVVAPLLTPLPKTMLQAFTRRMTPEDVRMRLFYSRRSMEHSELARLTQIDYAPETRTYRIMPCKGGWNDMWKVVQQNIDVIAEDAHRT